MDRIILADGTSYEIADGTSLGRIQIKANGYDAIKPIVDSFNSGNLKSVQFKRNDSVLGTYENLVNDGFSFKENGETASVTVESDSEEAQTVSVPVYLVTISLREKTELEKRVDALEAGQAALKEGHESNAGAIEELADMVAGSEV